MKKKVLSLLFTALCLLLCIVPSVGMIFRPTTEPIGNERSVERPAFTNRDGSVNTEFFTDLGKYFEQHFAFRAEAITADAALRAGVFGVSNIDTVTVGTDGWLYYSATLDDYLGRDTLSSREVQDVIHNLSLIQDYSRAQGAEFLFTVPPNKNTLYPSHMPYYDAAKAGDVHNRDLLRTALADSDINYVDLFGLFEEQDEVLYFARDSHWNNKGALLAYDKILTALGKAHDDYSDADVVRKKDFIGDLSRMIYPASTEAEYNYYYGAEDRYTYVTDTESVEDPRITTENPDAAGKLYMYRDSFGNALVPFFAGAYAQANFTKSFPLLLERDLGEQHPDTFILELVERNIDWLISRPPVFPSPKIAGYQLSDQQEADAEIRAEKCLYSTSFVQFTGAVDSTALTDNDVILVAVTDSAGHTVTYECFGLSAEDGKTGFIAYAHAEDYPEGSELDISVIKQNGSEFIKLADAKVTLSGGNYEKE